MAGRQGRLITRAAVYNTARAGRVVLTCTTCQHTFEPTRADWRHADTSCPRCGGWTITASVTEPGARS
jgi:predicted RNA-binding Zn-ribbon protein involved in translation (DUF1610 family)